MSKFTVIAEAAKEAADILQDLYKDAPTYPGDDNSISFSNHTEELEFYDKVRAVLVSAFSRVISVAKLEQGLMYESRARYSMYLPMVDLGCLDGNSSVLSDLDSVTKVLEKMQTNRIETILAYAHAHRWHREAASMTSSLRRQFMHATGYHYVQIGLDNKASVFNTLNSLQVHKIEREDILQGLVDYKDNLKDMSNRQKNQELMRTRHSNEEEGAVTGLRKILNRKPALNRMVLDLEWAEISGRITNHNVARTWGWEVESPDAKGVALNYREYSEIDKGDDGSLRSENGSYDDCECDCGDCTYHECNCDNCDSYNDSPDHCDGYSCISVDSAEFRTTNGLSTSIHKGLNHLCAKLQKAEAEINDSAGTHIHVWAGDLTTHQVGQVMAIYKITDKIWDHFANRCDNNYSKRLQTLPIQGALSRTFPRLIADKPRAVNVTHLNWDRKTIEFRQMDCNYDARKITTWAWFMRGIVESASKGATFVEFKHVTSLREVVKIFEKYGYTPAMESGLMFGSFQPEKEPKIQKHIFA